jgi:hypothetical protein
LKMNNFLPDGTKFSRSGRHARAKQFRDIDNHLAERLCVHLRCRGAYGFENVGTSLLINRRRIGIRRTLCARFNHGRTLPLAIAPTPKTPTLARLACSSLRSGAQLI